MKQLAGMRPMPQVICGFPGIGKSTFVRNAGPGAKVLDSDSSTFDKQMFPANYMEHIKARTAEGNTILASSHDVVRNALVAEGIPFVLVYPTLDCKDEYLQRYRDRGSPDAFIKLLDANWSNWIIGCMRQSGCAHYCLGSGQYIPSLEMLRARLADPAVRSWK